MDKKRRNEILKKRAERKRRKEKKRQRKLKKSQPNPQISKPTKFEQIDGKDISVDISDICLFVATRNNELLIPSFFEHYRKIGVSKFFVIDNMSTDSTVDFLLGQEDAYIFQTDEPYRKGSKGGNWNRWANRLLHHAYGSWCIASDSDEFLIYPDYETKKLDVLISQLEKEGSTGVRGYLIDMYSKCAIRDAVLEKGGDPFNILEYFDSVLSRNKNPRSRMIGKGISLNKFCIFKNNRGIKIKSGHHRIKGCKISNKIRVGLLHFKFSADYIKHVGEESRRGTYWGRSRFKKLMNRRIRLNPKLTFYNENVSCKYEGSKQLEEMGKIKWDKMG